MVDRRGTSREAMGVRHRPGLRMLALSAAAIASVCVVLLMGIPMVDAGAGLDPGGTARIEFEEAIFDFGTMYQHEEVTHQFMFWNAGAGLLQIGKVQSTCGCTTAMPQGLRLAPGEKSSLDVTFRSGSFRDRIAKHVYVDSNDPVQPRVVLTIQGQVLVEVNVVPRGIHAGSLEVGEAVQRFVEITPEAIERFKILGVESDNPAVRAGPPQPLGEGRQGYRLPIEIGPCDEPGRLRAKVTVRTDLHHNKEFQIGVYAKIIAAAADGAAPQAQ